MERSTISRVRELISSVRFTGSPRAGEPVPAGEELRVRRTDDLRELGDDAPVEERLHHVALAGPELPFAGHEALAEQDPHPIEAESLRVVAVVRDQHPLHVVRMVDDVGMGLPRRDIDPVDIAMPGEELDHPLQRVVRGADIELKLGLGRLGLHRCGSVHGSRGLY